MNLVLLTKSNGSMKMENKIDRLKMLRVPFEAHQISKLPKPYSKDSPKGNCKECGGYHGLPAIHLDYVGHAALTDRLLEVDPLWNWKPHVVDANGAPLLDKDGGMWIELTICGVTRLGYGDAQGKTGGNATKERIGDALRNAAMRFGAALDLWHKGDLHGNDDQEETQSEQSKPNDFSAEIKMLRDAKSLAALLNVWNELDKPTQHALLTEKDACKAKIQAANKLTKGE